MVLGICKAGLYRADSVRLEINVLLGLSNMTFT